MRDFDVLDRFNLIVGFGSFRESTSKNQPAHWSRMWEWKTTRFETTQALIAMLWPWLGERRKARAKEVLMTSKTYFASSPRRGETRPRCISIR
jgi:hypothetical protein